MQHFDSQPLQVKAPFSFSHLTYLLAHGQLISHYTVKLCVLDRY